MTQLLWFLSFIFLLFPQSILADSKDVSHDPKIVLQTVRDLLREIAIDNDKQSTQEKTRHYRYFMHKQEPRATVVLCSDSRVQTDDFNATPKNDLFVIRNIGNQFDTAKGSVEYGVEHLHTPLLLIVGHSDCGAIKTAATDYSQLSPEIRQELDQLHFDKEKGTNDAILANIHHQVDHALVKFQKKVKEGTLIVMGAVYDFRNDFGKGLGKLVFVNVNGEKDLKKLQKSDFLKGVEHLHIGTQDISK